MPYMWAMEGVARQSSSAEGWAKFAKELNNNRKVKANCKMLSIANRSKFKQYTRS